MALDPIAYEPYLDPDDFIREVTDRIWVDRDIEYIYENFEPDSVVHTGLGTVTTRAEVIEGSLMRMAEAAVLHPDAQPGQAADVVWEARGDDAFLSSHLVLRVDDVAIEGRPRKLPSHSIANCLYRRGRMVEEWIARDRLASVLNRGRDPEEVARQLGFRGYAGSFAGPAPADVLREGDSGPRPDEYRAECELVLELIDEVWNRRNLNKVNDLVIRDSVLHSVGESIHLRPSGYQGETLRLLGAFPTAQFEVRDVQTNCHQRYAGLRIAVLWKLSGRYDGRPHYGPVTGADVSLLGVSQFLLQGGRIVRERRIYDEIALRAQINAARGDAFGDPANIYFC